MSGYLKAFVYVPYAVFAVSVGLFVLRLNCRWRWKALWTAWLGFCCLIFAAFRQYGAGCLSPRLPEALIWFWSWAYAGAMFLCALSVAFFWKFRGKAVILPILAWGVSAYGVFEAVRPSAVREVRLAFPDLPVALDGYRIVQVSDLHASHALRAWRTRAVVETVNALAADIVCLTGDFADGPAADLLPALEPLKDLKARDGVWAVTGNHEWFLSHASWWPHYANCGLRFLANECVFPRPELALGGVHDFELAKSRLPIIDRRLPDVAQTFAAATNGEFRVLMEHQPVNMHENLTRHGVRLQLSGHTHGGFMPGLASLISWLNGGFLKGIYWEGVSVLYVNAGCGQSAGFLMRLFDASEIAVISLHRSSVDEGKGTDGRVFE